MDILYTPRFTREAKKLPRELRRSVEHRIALFQENPFDTRLKTHKLAGSLASYWSFSIDHRHRIIFEFRDNHTVVFRSIGDHSIYDNI